MSHAQHNGREFRSNQAITAASQAANALHGHAEQPQQPALPHRHDHSSRSHRKVLPDLPSEKRRRHRSKPHRSFWSSLSRRTIIISSIALSLLLILIIGLAAGLSSRSKSSNLPLPSDHGGPYTGDLTYYSPGLGACGVASTDSDAIVAVSHLLYDAVQIGSNPNTNPLCGMKLRAKRVDRSVDLTVVDRCTGCQARDLDVTVKTFASLADVNLGRVQVEWAWLEDVPQSNDSLSS